MTMLYALKSLFFLVLLFFYQQGLANDTYRLEKFRNYQMKNWKPLSKEQQMRTGQPGMSPLENIRIGFVRLNLASDDLTGDGRLEICEDYEVDEQDFNRLNNFYFNYVNRGNPQRRKVRIQRVLRLIQRIFAMNINMTNGQSPADKQRVGAKAKSLFEQLFLSVKVNGRSNPYFHYFFLGSAAHQSSHVGVNHGLVLMLLAFLGPHFLSPYDFYTYCKVLGNRYTKQSYGRAFDSSLLSENINEYNSPQSIANQLIAAQLDAETALLIGLTAIASAAFQCVNLDKELQETLETVLREYLQDDLLIILHSNIVSYCHPVSSCPAPRAMFTGAGIERFTRSLVGIDFSSESSDSEYFVEESNSEHQDQSIVIQQQNELITQLRRELAYQTATEEAGAVGGVSGETKKCPLCTGQMTDNIVLNRCGHAGFCKNCAEQLVYEQRKCPFCRDIPLSYIKIRDMSFP
ncbi:RING finger protein [Endozoicomonas sp. 8E]|uniref:RING finger protein n=1 Tax=Endozoicomonas sp. 8E TaxID=3035692 RepID=UPI002938F70C|nr:RING finger protein [Endozoicomonas sp. 8E]WOG29208.1 RING finger protein [Endozoicomonas sp. 8E]